MNKFRQFRAQRRDVPCSPDAQCARDGRQVALLHVDVNEVRGVFPQVQVFGVGGDTDDFHGKAVTLGKYQRLSDRVLSREVVTGERSIDDGNAWSCGTVLCGKVASLQ